MKTILKYLKFLRIHHYIKNILIFFPLFFSGNILNLFSMKLALIGFIAFSLTASLVYVINDIQDIEKDKLHPVKKNRPLPKGEISIVNAKNLALLLFLIIIFVHIFIIKSLTAFLFLFTYFILNVLYSIYLKNIAFIDLLVLVSGFFLRILYGGALLKVEISHWLYLTVIAASL